MLFSEPLEEFRWLMNTTKNKENGTFLCASGKLGMKAAVSLRFNLESR